MVVREDGSLWCPHMSRGADDLSLHLQWQERNNLPAFLQKYRPARPSPDFLSIT